jgi:hypothetical protein
MSRSDISNRVRDSIHTNYMFRDVDSLITGSVGDDLRDTFIFNQSWWLKDRVIQYSVNQWFGGPPELKDVGLFFRLGGFDTIGGMTSGHTHTHPEKRAELVLGLMNRIRGSHDLDFVEGCPPLGSQVDPLEHSCLPPELLQLHVWDPNDWNDGPDFGHPDMNPFQGDWSDDALKPNWMHNQPPAFERTPMRPVFTINFRNATKPAVPEGGFLKRAKLTLTVSQQSIAWPRNGFTAEVWKLVDDVGAECDWYNRNPQAGLTLSHDNYVNYPFVGGHTLGNWYPANLHDGTEGGHTYGGKTHFLPTPMNPALPPKYFRTDWDWTAYGSASDHLGPARFLYDPAGVVPCGASSVWLQKSNMIWPAIDTELKGFGAIPLLCRKISIPTPDDCDWSGQGTCYDTWSFLKRAPETQGLTGCGGAIDIGEAGFMRTDSTDIEGIADFYNDDGSLPIEGHGLDKWTPVKKQNSRGIHIPKFTNAGFSGSYINLTTPNGIYDYATGPTGAADGRGITFSVDLGWWGRNAIAYSGQKLNLMLKGEFTNRGNKNELSEYESAGAIVELPEPNRHLNPGGGPPGPISPFSGPIDTTYGDPGEDDHDNVINLDPVLPLTGTGDFPMTWSVNSGQIATNFYSVESPTPHTAASLYFKSKGSTMDIETGNLNIEFGLWHSYPGGSDVLSHDLMKLKWSNATKEGRNARDRILSVFTKLQLSDDFQLTMGTRIEDNNGGEHQTAGYIYKISPGSVSVVENIIDGYVELGVTGAQKLFPTYNADTPGDINVACAERILGNYKISTDDEHWILSTDPWITMFSTNDFDGSPAPSEIYPSLEQFTGWHWDEDCQPPQGGLGCWVWDDSGLPVENIHQAPHPSGGYYPVGPNQPIVSGVNSGVTAGSFIKINCKDYPSPNNGSYSIIEARYKDEINQINQEYVRVKEPLENEINPFTNAGIPFNIQRIDHHPRIEITYRTKRQFDIPT